MCGSLFTSMGVVPYTPLRDSYSFGDPFFKGMLPHHIFCWLIRNQIHVKILHKKKKDKIRSRNPPDTRQIFHTENSTTP